MIIRPQALDDNPCSQASMSDWVGVVRDPWTTRATSRPARLGDTGLEPPSLTDSADNHLQKSALQGGAESGAVEDGSHVIDPDLLRVIDAWPELPAPIRSGILAMIQAAGEHP